MADMLVNLLQIEDYHGEIKRLKKKKESRFLELWLLINIVSQNG